MKAGPLSPTFIHPFAPRVNGTGVLFEAFFNDRQALRALRLVCVYRLPMAADSEACALHVGLERVIYTGYGFAQMRARLDTHLDAGF